MNTSDSRRAAWPGLLMAALMAVCATAALAQAALSKPASSVLASGLDEPKQLAVGPDGWVYVALSGHAAPGDPLLDGSPFSKSSGIVRVSPGGTVAPVASGLLSRFDEGTAIGVSGLAFWHGSLFAAQGLSDPLNGVAGALLSSPVLKVEGGTTRVFTSFNALPNDPSDSQALPDTNPFGCAIGNDGDLYVSDGGDNGVWRVEENGDSSMFVQFPGDPTVAGIAALGMRREPRWERGDHRADGLVVCLFGNGISGFANGSVQVANRKGYHTLVPQGVITMPIGAAYSPAGKLYILQFATPNTRPGPPFAPGTGAIWSVSPTGAATKVLGGLNWPTSICFGRDGTAYVSNNGILPANGTPSGEVLKVTGL